MPHVIREGVIKHGFDAVPMSQTGNDFMHYNGEYKHLKACRCTRVMANVTWAKSSQRKQKQGIFIKNQENIFFRNLSTTP
jgi:hypothetical protein